MWFWGVEDITDGYIQDELSCDQTQEQLKEFLVEYFGYDEDYANEEVGWDEEGEVTEE